MYYSSSVVITIATINCCIPRSIFQISIFRIYETSIRIIKNAITFHSSILVAFTVRVHVARRRRRRRRRGGGGERGREESTGAKQRYEVSNVYRMHGVSQKLMYDLLATRTCPFVLSVLWRKSWWLSAIATDGSFRQHYEKRRDSQLKFIFVPPLVIGGRSSSSNRSLLRSVTITRESREINRDR